MRTLAEDEELYSFGSGLAGELEMTQEHERAEEMSMRPAVGRYFFVTVLKILFTS